MEIDASLTAGPHRHARWRIGSLCAAVTLTLTAAAPARTEESAGLSPLAAGILGTAAAAQAVIIGVLLRSGKRARSRAGRGRDLPEEASGVCLWVWRAEEDSLWMHAPPPGGPVLNNGGHLTSADFAAAVLPEDRPIWTAAWKAMTPGEPAMEVETRFGAQPGQAKTVLTRARARFDTTAKLISVTGVCSESTAITRFTGDSDEERAKAMYLARAATMGELTATIAHEVNQPLAAILNNAQAARNFLDSPNPDLEEVRLILEDIITDDERAAGVVRRVRDLLKRKAPSLEPVCVNELLQETLKMVRMEFTRRGVSTDCELEEDLPQVAGEKGQLQQVLLNILMNASDAMKECIPGERELFILTRSAGGYVELLFIDSGRGIRPEENERLFDPYFSNKEEGLGMGLAICRSIIQAHGGRIWLEANASRGATAGISLPVASRKFCESEQSASSYSG